MEIQRDMVQRFRWRYCHGRPSRVQLIGLLSYGRDQGPALVVLGLDKG